LVHGLGANTGRWESMAEFFLKRGIESYAVELARTDGFDGYFKNISRLQAAIKAERHSAKIFLAGESMGALISFLFVSSHPGLFSGLVCISPAFANRIRLSAFDQFKIALSLIYNPRKMFTVPFDSSMCTRDTEYRKKMDADPSEHRTASAKLLWQILFYQAAARRVKNITSPVLFLTAGQDKISDNAPARAIFERLEAGDKELVEFPGMYHALTIDIGKEDVFKAILDWTEERL
jgi:alpha-beta hydrolase superfamily lysophospholipase